MNTKVTRNTYRPIFPTPAGLVVSVDAAGKPNIITLGEIFNLSIREPVWVGIAIRETRYSWKLIKQQKEFTVNLPPTALLNAMRGIGVYSGRDVDKFAKYKLTALPSKFVKPPDHRRMPGKSGMQTSGISSCRRPRFIYRGGAAGAR